MKKSPDIAFSKFGPTGDELRALAETLKVGELAGGGPASKRVNAWLEDYTGAKRAYLTHSCTTALEIAALIAGVEPGDEVIMPSYTFASTANAFVLRGATPVFVDIRPDTLNLDERLLEAAITPKTRAIVPVHYAGVACEMDQVMAIAAAHDLMVIEDAAQGFAGSYKGRKLGSIGQMGTLSFHQTKNLSSGEGGALLVNDPALVDRVDVVCEKGTNRRQFFGGFVDKYTWVDVGYSPFPSDVVASLLHAQLMHLDQIQAERTRIVARYDQELRPAAAKLGIQLSETPADRETNGHMFYLLFADPAQRTRFLASTKEGGVTAVFHYVPLHSSPAGKRYGRAAGTMNVTDAVASRLARLPLYYGMTDAEQTRVIAAVKEALLRL